MNRASLTPQLERLAQLTIAIQFDFNSVRIRPDSFQVVGLMVDARYHPYLQNYRFLVVGHADGHLNMAEVQNPSSSYMSPLKGPRTLE